MTDQLDCVVIGAGAIGLAIARSLAMSGRDVVVLEREDHIGMHTSSRNSEVIHAGLYYPEESLKAQLCVAGKEMLYALCDEYRIPVERMGKLLLAADDSELERLYAIQAQAQKNGVDDLQLLSAQEVQELEPTVTCVAALLSPSTGIIDSHAYMLALQSDIEAFGGMVVCNSEVSEIVVHNDGFFLSLRSLDDEEFVCNTLINAAGNDAQAIASLVGAKESPTQYLAKGQYFAYQGSSPFNHLIYPLPFDGGLGIHATNDLGGAARFGPDVVWVDEVDYEFDPGRKPEFVTTIRRYYPGLDEDRLVPAYCGVRPKLSGPGEAPADFMIHDEEEHGVPGLINLFGFDSPGLTSSLAVGEYVKSMLD
jgi:L-2-hydroxyglutarate oxidase LhgO